MRIWIDADACPRMAKEAVYKAAFRWKIPIVLVANRAMVVPRANLVSLVVVGGRIDEADAYIAENSLAGDLAVTADIPLADRLVGKGVVAIDPRGNVFTPGNVKEALATRDLMQELREGGVMDTGGPAPITDKDRERFINALERELVRLQKRRDANQKS